MKCSSGASADSDPEMEARLGEAPGTRRATVRPSPALGSHMQAVPSVKHSLSVFPSPKPHSRWEPNPKGS